MNLSITNRGWKAFLSWGKAAAALLILSGMILRIRQYLTGRSLWVDEAMLALNIVERDFAGMFQPLEYDQGAPVGFLLVEKLFNVILGKHEFALRLFPLLAGLASLWLFYLLLRRITRGPGLLVPLALFALNPRLIYYSSEVKQYILDVALTILLLLAAASVFQPSPRKKDFAWLGLAGMVALYIFLETATRYLTHLREINRMTEAIEDQLQKSTRNREVLELLKYQKSLTYFATALRSNEVMMERVQRTQIFNYYEEDQDLLEDVLTENQQAIQMTNINTEILSSMMDAFASIISNNLNSVMKALAALTIILNLPTIVAGFYGMNVTYLPGAAHPLAFLNLIGIAIALTAVVTFIFYKRDWF